MDAAIAALLGAALGALGSIGGVWLQQRHQSSRDRLKLAADLGLADYNQMLERAKTKGGPMPPISLFVAYHIDALDALAKGEFDEERIAEIEERQTKLLRAMPLRYKPDLQQR